MRKKIILLTLISMLLLNSMNVFAYGGYDTNVYYASNQTGIDILAESQKYSTISEALSNLSEVRVPITIINNTDMNISVNMIISSYDDVEMGDDWRTMLGPVKCTAYDPEEGCALDGEQIEIAPGQNSATIASDLCLPMIFCQGSDYVTIVINTDYGSLWWSNLYAPDYFYNSSTQGITLTFNGTYDSCTFNIN